VNRQWLVWVKHCKSGLIIILTIIVSSCSGGLPPDIGTTVTVTLIPKPTVRSADAFTPEPMDTSIPELTVTPTLAPTNTFPPEPTHTLTVTPELTTTPISRDVAEIVLQQSAQFVCPLSGPGEPHVPEVYVHGAVCGFVCIPATGHDTSVRIEQFAGQIEAQAAFNSTRGDNPIQDFHGFPLCVWQEQHPSFPDGRKEYRIWVWQADRWLIHVRAFDDTHFLIAPDPQKVSEAIYQAAIEHALFPVRDE
jgi:hypothetical protein